MKPYLLIAAVYTTLTAVLLAGASLAPSNPDASPASTSTSSPFVIAELHGAGGLVPEPFVIAELHGAGGLVPAIKDAQ